MSSTIRTLTQRVWPPACAAQKLFTTTPKLAHFADPDALADYDQAATVAARVFDTS